MRPINKKIKVVYLFMLRKIFLIGLLFGSVFCYSQKTMQSLLDSLANLPIHYEERRIGDNQKAKALLQKIDTTDFSIKQIDAIIEYYKFSPVKISKAKHPYLIWAKNTSLKLNDELKHAKILEILGDINREALKPEAFKYYNEAFDIYKKRNDAKMMNLIKSRIALYQMANREYKKSVTTFLEVIAENKKQNNHQRLLINSLNLGSTFLRAHDTVNGLKYMLIVEKLEKKYPHDAVRSINTSLLAEIFTHKKEYSKAKKYIQKTINHVNENGANPYLKYINYRDLGDIAEKQDSLKLAKKYYTKALKLAYNTDVNSYVNISLSNKLATVLIKEKNYKDAILLLDHIYQKKIKKLNAEYQIGNYVNFFKLSALAHQKIGNIKKAFFYKQKQIEYINKLNKAKVLKDVSELEKKYEKKIDEQKIALLQVDNQSYKKNIIIVVLLAFFAVLIFLFYYFWQRQKTKRLREQEEEAKKELQKKEEETATKERFFANISHELRTPVTLIKGPIQSFLKKYSTESIDTSLLKIANNNTDNLLHLVNQILDLTKLDGNKLIVEQSIVVLDQFLQNITVNFRHIFQKKQLKMVVDTYGINTLIVKTDKQKLTTILNNLISNAIKFTPEKGTITVKATTTANTITIAVKDTGIGIPAEDIPFIFDRYYQASINKKAEGGLDIGLALSKELVQLLDGKILVESNTSGENIGTKFTISLPKNEVVEAVAINDKAIDLPIVDLMIDEQKQKTVQENVNAPYILVVEDTDDLREYITSTLNPYYNVIAVENGKQALEVLKQKTQQISLILSDLMMPVMDGYELLNKVKSDEKLRRLPFIILTARIELDSKLKALRIGVDDYIVKPFDEEELLTRIENLLSNYYERINYLEKQVTTPKTNSTTLKDEYPLIIEQTIKEHMANPMFSVDFLAEKLDLSRNKIYKQIKSQTGLTPNQYIAIIKLQVAKLYLEQHRFDTVTEVATKVGFKKTAYFSVLFKKEFGKSPSSYFG